MLDNKNNNHHHHHENLSSRLPTYMGSSPLNKNNNNNDNDRPRRQHRYPSPVAADYTQATPLVRTEKPWVVLHFPRIYIDTAEVEIGPLDDGREEWRRLDPGVDGGWMAYPDGRWVPEGPGVYRWVR